MIASGLFGMATATCIYCGYRVFRKLAKEAKHAKFATYGHKIREFKLSQIGPVQYAQWQHPQELPKNLKQQDIDAIQEYLQPGDFVIDIGAHTGDTTLPFALAVGTSGCVLALEPNRYVYEILQINAKLNPQSTNIDPLCIAATETDGEYIFHYSDGAFCNGGFLDQNANARKHHRQPLKVQGRNLETLLRTKYADRLPRLKLIKIDTEGYDRQIIASLRNVLREFPAAIICEVYGGLNSAERNSLFDELANLNYDCYKREEEGNIRGISVTRDKMSQWKHFDILALPKQGAGKNARIAA